MPPGLSTKRGVTCSFAHVKLESQLWARRSLTISTDRHAIGPLQKPDDSTPKPAQATPGNPPLWAPAMFVLRVTLDVAPGGIRFDWIGDKKTGMAVGMLTPAPTKFEFLNGLRWNYRAEGPLGGEEWPDHCGTEPSSVHALFRRIRRRHPLVEAPPHMGILTDTDLGHAKAGIWMPVIPPPRIDPWIWLGREALELARLMATGVVSTDHANYARELMKLRVSQHLGVAGPVRLRPKSLPLVFNLEVEFDHPTKCTRFVWTDPTNREEPVIGEARCHGSHQFHWTITVDGEEESEVTPQDRNAIRDIVGRWFKRFPANAATTAIFVIKKPPGGDEVSRQPIPIPEAGIAAYQIMEEGIIAMGEGLRPPPYSPPGGPFNFDYEFDYERLQRRDQRKEQKRAEEAARRQEAIARLAEERRLRDERDAAARAAEARRPTPKKPADDRNLPVSKLPLHPATPKPPRPSAPLPPVPVTIKLPPLTFQETAFPLTDLRNFALRERGALWWVSNQSDDLLCLPNCRIQRLEYQVRTALRVLGPLRGRALLSDEVGLGKTIEAGLVLKELLTRGMVKRFLVLTLPSLVDQWAEELNDKFSLTTVTTNQPGAREDAPQFWRESPGIVASLHTLKQPAHLAVAREVHWDLLIVDEAHYLRNRDSQAWQAVNVLPRQFLLLLTATPVQNSLEELYNLVTLLMPGQLPTPREFRARFLDPKRPRQPRAPEELRRLLGQVMIRNTRANAGVDLPPRHAETVLFAPDETERAFWQRWETEFRACLARLNASQSSLWGRLLLRAAGSSPAAWRSALAKFPDAAAARAWREQAPLEASWRRKCGSIVPLARGAGGVVLFTEFLETQAALAEFLRGAGVTTFVINGSTPAPERQPITEQFRQHGGALVLTHSGTEGRNLQFCHCLANFDLPWNPMEIEQRIGRLHRLGQHHPVRIYNFVQAGTLQEHLLQILQDKLNLFELVVGETGLVLGERYSGDEFEEEVFRRWRESEGRVAEALAGLGDELAAARDQYGEVKKLDETLFAQDYESL
ncbi:MAG: DEAD/DEAH box helicase [Opitutus sp.]|nr:DEAD/DEAH box helicase [Opitutus sp.]